MERCRRVSNGAGGMCWIPGCWARAHNDIECTCGPRTGTSRDSDAIQRLERRIDQLERRLQA